jgi:hypothetical protein
MISLLLPAFMGPFAARGVMFFVKLDKAVVGEFPGSGCLDQQAYGFGRRSHFPVSWPSTWPGRALEGAELLGSGHRYSPHARVLQLKAYA